MLLGAVFLVLVQLTSAQWELCQVTNSDKTFCKCSSDFEVVLCQEGPSLKEMPTFYQEISSAVKILHVENNNISFWPERKYWVEMKSLSLVNIENNPVCMAPENLPRQVEIVLTSCTGENLSGVRISFAFQLKILGQLRCRNIVFFKDVLQKLN